MHLLLKLFESKGSLSLETPINENVWTWQVWWDLVLFFYVRKLVSVRILAYDENKFCAEDRVCKNLACSTSGCFLSCPWTGQRCKSKPPRYLSCGSHLYDVGVTTDVSNIFFPILKFFSAPREHMLNAWRVSFHEKQNLVLLITNIFSKDSMLKCRGGFKQMEGCAPKVIRLLRKQDTKQSGGRRLWDGEASLLVPVCV